MFKNGEFKHTLIKPLYNYGLLAFLLGLLLSSVIFIPAIIRNGGYFFYYGDFIAQEIPFYQMIHDAIQNGNTLWSSTTDLGSELMGSYSFYLLGSPFFWLTLLFPSEAVPYLMGPLFILKFGCATLTAYLYLKRYVSNKIFAVAGGLLYAFSGFSIYNIFFFHFHEPMIIFPLLLAAVDSFMYENKRGIVALAVFAACITNYYFFAGMAVFVVIYWLLLVFTHTYKLTLSKLILFIFEVLLGFIATAFLILPTVAFISGNPRLSELPISYDALAYNMPQRYIYIILSFFFPPEMPAQMVFAPDTESNWASVSGWLPLVGMTGVIGYLQLRKRDWVKKLITILFLMALVPILNSAFQMLNSGIYYARWYYMLVLIMCLATISAMENSDVDWVRAFKWTTGITVGIALLIGLIPDTEIIDGDDKTVVGLYSHEYTERFFIYIAIAVVSLSVFALIIAKFRDNKKSLAKATICGIVLISLISSTYIVQTGVSLDAEESKYLIENGLNKGSKLELEDIQEVRSDFYECVDNLAMYWQIPSMNAFHSTVTPSIMDFYDSVRINRDVASRPSTDKYGLRGLFSCKYLFDLKYDDDEYSFADENGETLMCGWEYLKDVNGCSVYENQYYIPMGFMYDSYISKEEFNTIDEINRSEALLKAMVLSMEDMEKYSYITGYSEEKYEKIKKQAEKAEEIDLDKIETETEYYQYGEIPYYKDCKKLADNSCEDFQYTSDGFEAVIENNGNNNLVFFSVPYNKGWKAYVNGEESEIVVSNIGFMSVEVPANTKSDIKFVYNPVGFHMGIIISCICGTIFCMYITILLVIKFKRKRMYNK